MLRPDWKNILTKAWSVRLMILAAILSGAEVALPFVDQWIYVPPGVMAALSGFTVAGAFLARLLVQKNMNDGDER